MKTITKLILKKIQKRRIILLIILLFICIAFVINLLSEKFLIEVPSFGGSMAEIQIGTTVRFINPVLANSPAEKDFLPLIYSSVLKRNSEGKIIPGIANISISEDKKKYTLKIHNNLLFSDGVKLGADDIIFTIDKMKDLQLNSPYFGN
jgi:peptide/nickel transport system substrate-binding protein